MLLRHRNEAASPNVRAAHYPGGRALGKGYAELSGRIFAGGPDVDAAQRSSCRDLLFVYR
ncbi:protein of unknown function [Pseudorhizobium banfieldiae]|uniref:Uncharacterized protein n=1 Tax=Pseudorhizobium banfieldiae TaxID=1125847 RepID=L0NF07_9HYPH|nr:protein of unknown function [Pseudorhizobium banfieldiae]